MGLTVKNIKIDGYLQGQFPQIPPTPVVAPVANFTASPTSGTVPLSVNFTDTSTNTPTSWLWDFKNDGSATSTQQNPSYTYSSTGTYAVKLTATNSAGSNSVTKTAFITVNDVAPQAGFTGTPTSGTIPLSVSFTNASTGTNLTYLWNFGNGTTSTAASPTATYSATGTYSVTLTASNTAGSSTSTRSNYITASDVAPQAGFSASPTSGTNPLTVSFTSASTGTNLNYVWDFMNNGVATTSTTATTASYTYANAGTYTVKLTASNSAGVSTATRSNLISVAQAVPENFNLVALQLAGTGANNATNNTFLDSSSNNFTITRVGNATQGSFSPYSTEAGYWSNYFDGTGDQLTVPANSAFDFGTGNYTIEFWFYKQSTANSNMFLMGSTVFFAVNASNTAYEIFLNGGGGTGTNINVAIGLNTWNHFALVKSSNVVTVYHNGVSAGTINNSSTNGYSNQTLQISGPFTAFAGYISNLRVVKGTAVYTSNFTPSTTPLTAISGTSLLTCQNNRFVDNSSNAFTITRVGDTSVSTFEPFVPPSIYNAATMGGSVYFDGSGDGLTLGNNAAFAFGNGDFTVDCWVYLPAAVAAQSTIVTNTISSLALNNTVGLYLTSNNRVLVSTYATVLGTSADNAVTTGSWNHIAFVRGSGTISVWANGTRVLNFANTNNYDSSLGVQVGIEGAGRPLNGYISNLRMVKGTAVYSPSSATITVPTALNSAISGTSLLLNGTNGAIFDASVSNALETIAGAKISTTVSANGSMYFDGTDDRLVMPANPRFAFGTGNFTVECWVYSANVSASQKGILQTSTTAGGLSTSYNTGLVLLFGMNKATGNAPGGFVGNLMGTWFGSSGGGVVAQNTWTHIAVVRNSGAVTTYINGVAIDTTTITANVTGNNLVVGGYHSGTYLYDGYLNDLRITPGLARYTANFTPPTRS